MAYSHYNTKTSKNHSKEVLDIKNARKIAIAKATKDDTFRTPRHVFADLVIQHPYIFPDKETLCVFDPSAGDGRYIKYLVKKGYKGEHRVNDLHSFELKKWHKSKRLYGVKKTIKDFFALELKNKYDLVITNPPFKYSEKFVEKMLTHVKPDGRVVIFEKHSFLTGQKRLKWLKSLRKKKMGCEFAIVISYRVAFDIDGVKDSDAATYNHSWFVFRKGYSGEIITRFIEKDTDNGSNR